MWYGLAGGRDRRWIVCKPDSQVTWDNFKLGDSRIGWKSSGSPAARGYAASLWLTPR
jgi:hypothetical protein